MSDLILCLYEDHLPAGCPAVYLPGGPRALYVREGGLTVEGAVEGRWLGEGQGHVTQSETALINGAAETVLWRWELIGADLAPSAPLPSAPATHSTLKLAAPIELDRRFDWLMRCDRVDFPPGGVALTHVHQGPGVRICLHGEIRIETLGDEQAYPAGQAWFELGHAPVLAPTTDREPTAFIRCFLLPRQLKGRSSIRYARAEDAAAPKVQQYRVFAERYIDLP
ncbi:MAG TPA: hypothetical protein VD865_05120 [Stenotrophomonas sp.]|nr:hypothetical protein [Stenotrophomonas sp.]